MRIAVPYEDGAVSQHYGSAPAFKLYDTEGTQVTGEEVVETEGRGHYYMVQFLVNHHVDLVLCRSCGSPARSSLEIARIGLVTGADGAADQAVRTYLDSLQ